MAYRVLSFIRRTLLRDNQTPIGFFGNKMQRMLAKADCRNVNFPKLAILAPCAGKTDTQ